MESIYLRCYGLISSSPCLCPSLTLKPFFTLMREIKRVLYLYKESFIPFSLWLFIPLSLLHNISWWFFNRSLSDYNSPQVSRTLPSILANLNNTVVWMVSTCLLISKSSSPFTSPLVTVPSALVTFGLTITFMFIVFQFSSKVEVLICLFTFFQFYFMGSQSLLFSRFSFFCWLSIGLVIWLKLADLFVSQNHYHYYYYYVFW